MRSKQVTAVAAPATLITRHLYLSPLVHVLFLTLMQHPTTSSRMAQSSAAANTGSTTKRRKLKEGWKVMRPMMVCWLPRCTWRWRRRGRGREVCSDIGEVGEA